MRGKHDMKSIFTGLRAQLPEIRSMAMMPYDAHWREEWHRPWCCEMHYVIQGNLAMEFRHGVKVSAGTSELLLIPPGVWHRDVYDLAQPPRVFMLFFSWKMEKEFWRQFPREQRNTLRIPANREISSMFSRVQTTLKSGAPLDELVTRVYIQAVLLLALRLLKPEGEPDSPSVAAARRRRALILKAKQYVETHYREYISLDGIAAALSVSPYHLSHVFSRESGISLFEYLAELRMRQARLLLQRGELPVKEIAGLVGFRNLQYFSHAFHRHYGVPPRALAGKPFVHKKPDNRRRRYS